MPCEDDARSALAALTTSADATPGGLSRRRFVQAAVAGGTLLAGGAALAGVADRAAALASTGPTGVQDPILLTVLLGGGNDGLNMVPPVGDGRYRDLRGVIAVDEAAALPIGGGYGLHPALGTLKGLWDRKQLAILPGLGHGGGLSHFDSMASWMAGGPPTPPVSGWLGRWLDAASAADPNPLLGVAIGSGVPLHLLGRRTAAAAIPSDVADLFGADRTDPSDVRLAAAAVALGVSPSGLGAWADTWSGVVRSATDLAAGLKPLATPALPAGPLAGPMALAARLLAGGGTRVLHVSGGDHDTHADEPDRHARRMAELDAGIAAFYASATAAVAARTVILVFSEFGRRPKANGSQGTDHGSATTALLVGPGVKGGIATPFPSLVDLDDDGNLRPATDFRSLYATVLDGWLGGDATSILGGVFSPLDVIRGGGAAPAPVTGLRPMRRIQGRSQRRALSVADHRAGA